MLTLLFYPFFSRERFWGLPTAMILLLSLGHDGEDQAEMRQVCYISRKKGLLKSAMLLMLHGQQQQQQSCYLTEKLFSILARSWRRLNTSSKGRRCRRRSTSSDSLAGSRSNVILSNDFQTIFFFPTNFSKWLLDNKRSELDWYFLLHNKD